MIGLYIYSKYHELRACIYDIRYYFRLFGTAPGWEHFLLLAGRCAWSSVKRIAPDLVFRGLSSSDESSDCRACLRFVWGIGVSGESGPCNSRVNADGGVHGLLARGGVDARGGYFEASSSIHLTVEQQLTMVSRNSGCSGVSITSCRGGGCSTDASVDFAATVDSG